MDDESKTNLIVNYLPQTMTQEEIREIRKEAKKTFFEFQVLEQTLKKSVMQFAYKNCKKILQVFK